MDSLRSKETLQDLSKKLLQEKIKSNSLESSKERTIFVLGSAESGKSTIVNRFLERDEPVRPTLALDYSFARRSSGHSFQKLICHFWELGSVENAGKLMEIPFRRGTNISTSSVVLVLDLSQPEELWRTIEESLTQLRDVIQALAKENYSSVLEAAVLRLGENYNDLSTLDVFPVPILIIGSKYDLYQNFEPEVKKQICKCLRSVAHLIGASLLFYSSQLTVHHRILRDVLNTMGFNASLKPIKAPVVDYMGPLAIGYGQDSWDKIGSGACSFTEVGANFRRALNFNENDQKRQKKKTLLHKDPTKENDFREPAIDEARAHKDQEILNFVQNADVRVKFENILWE